MLRFRARYKTVSSLREDNGWTQETLAELAEVGIRTIQQMESEKEFEGGRTFQESTFDLVATQLGVLVPDIAHDVPKVAGLHVKLRGALDAGKERCRASNQFFHTPHLMHALLVHDGLALNLAIKEHGDLESITRRLGEIVNEIGEKAHAFVDFELEENEYVRRGLEYARVAPNERKCHDGDVALALVRIGLSEEKQIVQWLKRRLGSPGFENVLQSLEEYDPEDTGTPAFKQSTIGEE